MIQFILLIESMHHYEMGFCILKQGERLKRWIVGYLSLIGLCFKIFYWMYKYFFIFLSKINLTVIFKFILIFIFQIFCNGYFSTKKNFNKTFFKKNNGYFSKNDRYI